jgi:Sulfotransferase family
MEPKADTPIETAKRYYLDPHHFIVGCARSGTTLLHRIVDAHPEIAITPEMHWITHHFKSRNGLVTPELVSELAGHKRFSQFEINREQFEDLLGSGEPVSYPTFLSSVFGLYGKIKNKPLVGNKTPAYVRSIPTLHGLWPKAKFVHIIRDGRDVCLSILNWKKGERIAGRFATWSEDPVFTTALWWKWNVRLGREDGAPLGADLYHEVHYEALVSEPAKTCETLCEFLGVPYDDVMLKFHERLPDPRFYTKQNKWRPIVTGLRDWRTQMPAQDLERFEAAAGELLEELGYHRAVPDPPGEMMENASRIRNSFRQDALARYGRLPKGWER